MTALGKFYSPIFVKVINCVFLLIFIFLSQGTLAQNQDNLLSFSKGEVYDYRMNKLDYSQIKYFMKDSPVAFSHLKTAKTFQIAGTSIAVLGGSILLISGNVMQEEEEYDNRTLWSMFIGGGGMMITGFIIRSGYKKNAETAVNLYNDGMRKLNSSASILKLAITPSGVKIEIQF